jgi:predicted metal-dependent enzyme (double-stranded beta helix superfamily)
VDLDALLADIVEAAKESTPQLAVRDVLARALADPGALADVLPCTRAELVPLHVSAEVSIFKAIWAPGMEVPPHDHLLWAANGVYAGREDNAFWRRAGGALEGKGGRTLDVGDIALLGTDVIHSVTTPSWTGAIHVYGGDFLSTPRSIWLDGVEEPNDGSRTQAIFEAANADRRD